MSACLSVCPLAYIKNNCPNFTKFSVPVTCAVARSLLTTFCTSDFADDVMFAHNGLYGARPRGCIGQIDGSVMVVYDCLVRKMGFNRI